MQECDNQISEKSLLKFLTIMKKFHILALSLHRIQKIHLNVSHTDFNTMCYIMQIAERNPNGVSIGNLAKALKVSPPAASKAISSLEKRGFVKRMINLNNRRIVTVIPTENGKKAMDEDKIFFEKVARNVYHVINEEKLNEIDCLLQQVYDVVYDTIEKEKRSI